MDQGPAVVRRTRGRPRGVVHGNDGPGSGPPGRFDAALYEPLAVLCEIATLNHERTKTSSASTSMSWR